MERAVRQQLRQRALAHLTAGTTDLTGAVMRQPVAAYVDPEIADAERRAMRSLPLVVAHSSELDEPGAFTTLDVLGTPLLLVRQDDGSLRALANVCRHRGARVVTEEQGQARAFSCPFHAWSYHRDGGLRSVSYPGGFEDVDPCGLGLRPFTVEERHGFVWVTLDPPPNRPQPTGDDVESFLGPELDDDLRSFGLADHVVERSHRFENDISWKLVIDGFLEDYHLRFLHAKTIGPYFAPDLHVFDALGPHGRFVPLRRSFIQAARDEPEGDIDVLAHAIVLYTIFPSTVLLWQADHFELWTVLADPRDPLRSTTTVRLLTPRESVERERARWDKNWKILMETVPVEDWVAAASIQAGLRAGTQEHLLFGRNEPALQHFHRTLAAVAGSGCRAG